MKIKTLKIKNFRNIEDTQINFNEQMNVIYGKNAEGKTNILEALWLFTGIKSFRGAKNEDLLKFGAKKFENEIFFFEDGRNQTAKIKYDGKIEIFLNDNKQKSKNELLGKICGVIFSPDDLDLISNGPSVRRKFIDSAVCQIYPNYAAVLRKYTVAVRQRNTVLKDLAKHPELDPVTDAYETEIVREGLKIIKYRKRFLELISKYIGEIYEGISGGREKIETEYVSDAGSTPEEFAAALKTSRSRDVLTLSTSIGPHRDNLKILINGYEARNFGSQGQKRSAAITLKLAEAEVIKETVGREPIILLDDVMSELDAARQKYIINHIKGKQVFVTCCDPSNVKGLDSENIIRVSGGKIINEKE